MVSENWQGNFKSLRAAYVVMWMVTKASKSQRKERIFYYFGEFGNNKAELYKLHKKFLKLAKKIYKLYVPKRLKLRYNKDNAISPSSFKGNAQLSGG